MVEREFFMDILLVRIYSIIEMIWSTGLAPWEFEFLFLASLISTFLLNMASFEAPLAGVDESQRTGAGTQGYLAQRKTPDLLGPP